MVLLTDHSDEDVELCGAGPAPICSGPRTTRAPDRSEEVLRYTRPRAMESARDEPLEVSRVDDSYQVEFPIIEPVGGPVSERSFPRCRERARKGCSRRRLQYSGIVQEGGAVEHSPYEQRVLAELEQQIEAADIAARERRRQRRRHLVALVGVVIGPAGLAAGLTVSWIYGLIGYAVLVASCLALLLDRPARRLLSGVRSRSRATAGRVPPLQ